MVVLEPQAEPDKWEIKVAEYIEQLGCRVVFLRRSLADHDRRCDSLVNGLRWEIKNPAGNGYLTMHNQLVNALYGQDKHHLNPQSSRIVISNERSPMGMDAMKAGLECSLSGDTGLSEVELACIYAVVLIDLREGKFCGYKKSCQVAPESLPGSLPARYDYTMFVHQVFGVGHGR